MAADDDLLPYRFTVAGVDVRMLIKQLKPAFATLSTTGLPRVNA